MHTMHSTLLVGLYDWEPERLPRQEFEERIEAFWRAMPAYCVGVAVYGDRRYNAELAYFTNLVPKLRDGLALIPRNGEPKVLVSGGANAMPPAARQTWLQKVDPLPDPGKAIAAWKAELGGPVALIGGDQLRQAVRKGVDEALGSESLSGQAASILRAQMRSKRPREIAALRESCAMLKSVVAELDRAKRKGLGVTAAIIVFLFSRVDLAVMAQHLARANAGLLLAALALYFFAIFLGALKWQILVHAQKLY